MATVMKISPQGQIRIPKTVMTALRLGPGDYIELAVENGQAILKPRILIDPTQGWYWTKEWQENERTVDRELENGRCSPVFRTAEEGVQWLDE